MDCIQIIEDTLKELKLGFNCIPTDRYLTIVTPYLYPDNDLIEVFVEEIGNDTIRVTDLGETLRHLESMGLDLFASRKRKFLLEQIAQRTHVILDRGKLQKEGTKEKVGLIMLDVIAAAHSVASLMYTSKAYEPTVFSEEVSEYLTVNNIKHQKDYPVIGLSGKKYRVNIQVDGSRPNELLIETLSPSQEYAITTTINRVIRLWFDIEGHREKVSLLNDVDFTWHNEDIVLLGRVSSIYLWSKKEQFLAFVKG